MLRLLLKRLGWKAIVLGAVLLAVSVLAAFGVVHLWNYWWHVRPAVAKWCGGDSNCSVTIAGGGLTVVTDFEKSGKPHYWVVLADDINLALITPLGEKRYEISVGGGMPIPQEARVVVGVDPPGIRELSLTYGDEDNIQEIKKDLDYDGAFDLRISRAHRAEALIEGRWEPARKRGKSWEARIGDNWEPIHFEDGKWAPVDATNGDGS